MFLKRTVATVLVTGMMTVAAGAATVFSEDFEGETAANNATTFAQFTVVEGFVDIIATSTFGIGCSSALCVDMDGSGTNAGRIESLDFAIPSGARVTLSFDYSGNQRFGMDTMEFGLVSGGVEFAGQLTDIPAVQGFSTATLSFTAPPIGRLSFMAPVTGIYQVFFDHAGGDDIGIILDNIRVEVTPPIPLPGTAALALAGLSALGAMRLLNRK